MKMEPIVSSETSAIKSQTPGNYPKRNKLRLLTRLLNKSHRLPNPPPYARPNTSATNKVGILHNSYELLSSPKVDIDPGAHTSSK